VPESTASATAAPPAASAPAPKQKKAPEKEKVEAADLGGLPRRSRQSTELPPAPVAEAPSTVTARTPQRVRANLAAFQRGTASGRASVVEESPAVGDNGPSSEAGIAAPDAPVVGEVADNPADNGPDQGEATA
jgi:hypothetical protein